MSVSRILRKHRDLARKEWNGPSATTPAYQIYDQAQNLYSTHMFQNAVQSRMLYEQVGNEFSARPIAPVWSQPVQNSWCGGCGRPCNWPMGHASALFAAAASSEASNESGTDCTTSVTHPSAYRGAEVHWQAPRQHSTILPTPATFAPRGSFTGPKMVGLLGVWTYLYWQYFKCGVRGFLYFLCLFPSFLLLFFFFFSSFLLLFFFFLSSGRPLRAASACRGGPLRAASTLRQRGWRDFHLHLPQPSKLAA